VNDKKSKSSALSHDASSPQTRPAPTPASAPSEQGLHKDKAGGAAHLNAAQNSSDVAPVVPVQGPTGSPNAQRFSPFNRILLGLHPSSMRSKPQAEERKGASKLPPPPPTITALKKGDYEGFTFVLSKSRGHHHGLSVPPTQHPSPNL
jgi:hypothetical protein